MQISPQRTRIRLSYRWAISLVAVLLVFGSLILPIALRPDALPLKAGEVSTSTIVAPKSLSYTSAVLTKKAQDEAVKSVQPRYLPADPAISRTQIDNLHLAINYIDTVRADKFSSNDLKAADLQSIKSLQLSPEISERILALTENQWQTVKQEAVTVLEQVMRNNIKDTQVEDYVRNIPSYIGFNLSNDESSIVQAFLKSYITPNSLYSEEETVLAREKAIANVQPVTKSYVENQTIISRGQIVSEEQYEALTAFGLTKVQTKSQDIIAALALVSTVSLFLYLYFKNRGLKLLTELRSLTVILIGFIVFLYGARFLIPNRAIIPYFFPLPAFAVIIASLFTLEISVIFSIALGILAAFGITNTPELTLYYIFTSVFAALLLGQGRRFTHFLYAAGAIGVSGVLVVFAYRLTDPTSDSIGLITLSAVAFLNGVASSSIALLIQYLLSQLLGLPTPLHLMDLSRPDHPLQKLLLQKTPGTYQHSLQVSNLAELAAEAIGANPLLTRVGTIYHDIGKTADPAFYVENQIPGHLDTHDDMDEVETAQRIIAHVPAGVRLAEKYHLPPRIRDFILEHHGTQITRYPYNQALAKHKNNPDKVNSALFQYAGPKPQSKETAILMLADGCEARARAELPANHDEMVKLVEKVFNRCLQDGQLENSPLTQKDLTKIKESFVTTLDNAHHPRVVYPEAGKEKKTK
jgi:putative nucleotidyltransferase with HDIG domain